MNNRRDVDDLDALPWHTSSYSGSGGGNCVEVAGAGGVVWVRDTKDRSCPALSVPHGEWSAFVARLAEGSR